MSIAAKKYKIIKYLKVTLHFLFLLIWKAGNSKNNIKEIQEQDKNKPNIKDLITSLSKNFIVAFDTNNTTKQNLKQLFNGKKKNFRTWTQIQLDFQEYYHTLKKEFHTVNKDNGSLENNVDNCGLISDGNSMIQKD